MIERMRHLVAGPLSWGRDHLGTLTSGQRWTSGLALVMAGVMLTAGMPSNVRIIARPPKDVALPPPAVVAPPALPPAFTPPIAFAPPAAPVVRPPARPSDEEDPHEGPTPVDVDHCMAALPFIATYPPPVTAVGAPIAGAAVEQARVVQTTYEETTGRPLGIDLPAVIAFATGCSDALPNADLLVEVAALLTQIYEALEAAGVPPINLPEAPVVSLPEIPAPLEPVVAALAVAGLPLCGGVSSVLALTPIAGELLPFPSSELLAYAWPVRAVCALFSPYQPAPPPESETESRSGPTPAR